MKNGSKSADKASQRMVWVATAVIVILAAYLFATSINTGLSIGSSVGPAPPAAPRCEEGKKETSCTVPAQTAFDADGTFSSGTQSAALATAKKACLDALQGEDGQSGCKKAAVDKAKEEAAKCQAIPHCSGKACSDNAGPQPNCPSVNPPSCEPDYCTHFYEVENSNGDEGTGKQKYVPNPAAPGQSGWTAPVGSDTYGQPSGPPTETFPAAEGQIYGWECHTPAIIVKAEYSCQKSALISTDTAVQTGNPRSYGGIVQVNN